MKSSFWKSSFWKSSFWKSSFWKSSFWKNWFCLLRLTVLENRRYLAVGALLFFMGIAGGVVLTCIAPQKAGDFLSRLIAPVARIARQLAESPAPVRVLLVFANNVRVILMMLIGSLAFGIFPVISLLANGVLIGLFASDPWSAIGLSPARLLISLAPHGLFEIPAVLFAAMLGFRLGSEMWALVTSRGHSGFDKALRQTAVFIPALLGLLLIAATMEVYVSPLLLG